MAKTLSCHKCHRPLPPEVLNTTAIVACPSCRASLMADVFPAFFTDIAPGQSGEQLQTAEEASCFYHPQKKAVVPCENCGRFLCALCDIEMHGKHLCPQCLESGKKKGKITHLEHHRTLYDSTTLRVAIYPILFVWLTLFTAPIALFLAIRYWNAPSSLLPRTKIRFILAILLAILQIFGWIALFWQIFT